MSRRMKNKASAKRRTSPMTSNWTSPGKIVPALAREVDPMTLCAEGRRMGDMLTYRRRYESEGEQLFIDKYILPLGVDTITGEREIRRSDERKLRTVTDGVMVEASQTVEQVHTLMVDHAYTLTITHPDGQEPTVAFCAHTDSVHNPRDPATRQRVAFDPNTGEFVVGDTAQVDCLGADDAAGCYVLIRMIEAGVPGRYVFFRGEEVGGIGSQFVAQHRKDVFDGIEAAIQFDRRGTESIITEMFNGPTCSNTFALSLAAALGMGHAPDPTGSFTDTANLTGIVTECTNVSVGYENEHSRFETLDWTYLQRLTDACITTFLGDVRLEIVGPQAEVCLTEDLLADMTDSQIERMVYENPDEVAQFLMDMRDAMSPQWFGGGYTGRISHDFNDTALDDPRPALEFHSLDNIGALDLLDTNLDGPMRGLESDGFGLNLDGNEENDSNYEDA